MKIRRKAEVKNNLFIYLFIYWKVCFYVHPTGCRSSTRCMMFPISMLPTLIKSTPPSWSNSTANNGQEFSWKGGKTKWVEPWTFWITCKSRQSGFKTLPIKDKGAPQRDQLQLFIPLARRTVRLPIHHRSALVPHLASKCNFSLRFWDDFYLPKCRNNSPIRPIFMLICVCLFNLFYADSMPILDYYSCRFCCFTCRFLIYPFMPILSAKYAFICFEI